MKILRLKDVIYEYIPGFLPCTEFIQSIKDKVSIDTEKLVEMFCNIVRYIPQNWKGSLIVKLWLITIMRVLLFIFVFITLMTQLILLKLPLLFLIIIHVLGVWNQLLILLLVWNFGGINLVTQCSTSLSKLVLVAYNRILWLKLIFFFVITPCTLRCNTKMD